MINKFSFVTSFTNNSDYLGEKPQPEVRFTFTDINELFVKTHLRKLKTNKAIGLDNISARLLKDSVDVISKSLTKMSRLADLVYQRRFG